MHSTNIERDKQATGVVRTLFGLHVLHRCRCADNVAEGHLITDAYAFAAPLDPGSSYTFGRATHCFTDQLARAADAARYHVKSALDGVTTAAGSQVRRAIREKSLPTAAVFPMHQLPPRLVSADLDP